jgi:hypothetical protein
MSHMTAVPGSQAEVLNLSYKELQQLAKVLGVKANVKKEVLQGVCWSLVSDIRQKNGNGRLSCGTRHL